MTANIIIIIVSADLFRWSLMNFSHNYITVNTIRSMYIHYGAVYSVQLIIIIIYTLSQVHWHVMVGSVGPSTDGP